MDFLEIDAVAAWASTGDRVTERREKCVPITTLII
jgi:hypothetical protein